ITPEARNFNFGNVTGANGGSAETEITGTWNDLTLETTGDVLFGRVSTQRPNTAASHRSSIMATGSRIEADKLQIGNFVGFLNGIGSTDLEQTWSDSELRATDILIAQSIVLSDATMDATIDLDLVDSRMEANDFLLIGQLSSESADSGGGIDLSLELDGSLMAAPEIDIANRFSEATQLDTMVSLTDSLIQSDDIEAGEGSTIQFILRGTTRADATLANNDVYSGIDAGTAAIDGLIQARFAPSFLPLAGTHDFDLIISDSASGLETFIATTEVINLPDGFSIDSFGVVEEGGVDILRLTISGAPQNVNIFNDRFEQ
ncbi:MAG: hypothetical protein AAGJ52_05660, partial [Pseudomonadota bacterium]